MARWSKARVLAYERPTSAPMKVTLPELKCLERKGEYGPHPLSDPMPAALLIGYEPRPKRFCFVFEPIVRLVISASNGSVRSLEPEDEHPADLVFRQPGQRIGISESNEPLVSFFRSNKWFRFAPEE